MALSDELEALAKRHGALSYRNRADTQNLAFVGYGLPPTSFDPDEAAPQQAAPASNESAYQGVREQADTREARSECNAH